MQFSKYRTKLKILYIFSTKYDILCYSLYKLINIFLVFLLKQMLQRKGNFYLKKGYNIWIYGMVCRPMAVLWYMGIFLLIVLAVIDKMLTLKFENFYIQTALKILILSFFLSYDSYTIIGEIINILTDCIMVYVLLQAKRDIELKQFPRKLLRKFTQIKNKRT